MATSDDTLEPLAALSKYGDALERAIIEEARDDLLLILQPYAHVWVNHVLPKRVNGDVCRITPEWSPFAARHYTALVRTYNAWSALRRLNQLCDAEGLPDYGALLVNVQDLCAGFWWNLGAAIDNFCQSLPSSPIRELKSKNIDYFRARSSELRYTYSRRTQFIHAPIVPLGVEHGTPAFNFYHLDNDDHDPDNLDENTDWEITNHSAQDLSFYDRSWDQFLKCLSEAWWHLSSLLEKCRKSDAHSQRQADQPRPMTFREPYKRNACSICL
jgi:hypothetical protein